MEQWFVLKEDGRLSDMPAPRSARLEKWESEEEIERVLLANPALLNPRLLFVAQERAFKGVADLVALDESGIPWVIEVKDERAPDHRVVGQLVTYMAMVQDWGHEKMQRELRKLRRDGQVTIAGAFREAFGKELPPANHGKVVGRILCPLSDKRASLALQRLAALCKPFDMSIVWIQKFDCGADGMYVRRAPPSDSTDASQIKVGDILKSLKRSGNRYLVLYRNPAEDFVVERLGNGSMGEIMESALDHHTVESAAEVQWRSSHGPFHAGCALTRLDRPAARIRFLGADRSRGIFLREKTGRSGAIKYSFELLQELETKYVLAADADPGCRVDPSCSRTGEASRVTGELARTAIKG